MELTGKVTQILAAQTGEGKNGTWRKQEFILETDGTYPKKICVSVWGDKIDTFSLKVGASLTASIEIESREYNSRWFTEVKAWKIAFGQQSNSNPPATNQHNSNLSTDDDGELPF